MIDRDVELNDLGDNFELRDDEFSVEPNVGHSIHSASEQAAMSGPTTCTLF